VKFNANEKRFPCRSIKASLNSIVDILFNYFDIKLNKSV
jgi:hypothetical protein